MFISTAAAAQLRPLVCVSRLFVKVAERLIIGHHSLHLFFCSLSHYWSELRPSLPRQQPSAEIKFHLVGHTRRKEKKREERPLQFHFDTLEIVSFCKIERSGYIQKGLDLLDKQVLQRLLFKLFDVSGNFCPIKSRKSSLDYLEANMSKMGAVLTPKDT